MKTAIEAAMLKAARFMIRSLPFPTPIGRSEAWRIFTLLASIR
jgi:hypothetical protein